LKLPPSNLLVCARPGDLRCPAPNEVVVGAVHGPIVANAAVAPTLSAMYTVGRVDRSCQIESGSIGPPEPAR
jgi:hypothetical protein